MQSEDNVKMGEGTKKAEMSIQDKAMVQGALDEGMNGEKSKMSKKQVVGLVVLSLIAIGGVLFGIYGMNSQNEQIAQLTVRATDAEERAAQLETEKTTIVNSDGEITEIADSALNYQNPVVRAESETDVYEVTYDIPVYAQGDGINTSLYLSTDGGQLKRCGLSNSAEKCAISGLPSDIYKMATIYEGNGHGSEKIGFLASDGSVWYVYVYNGGDVNQGLDMNPIAKKANIDGFVKDIISINFSYVDGPGHASTIFVMSDNSFVKYDESMFE